MHSEPAPPRPPARPARPASRHRWLDLALPLGLALLAGLVGELIRARVHPGLPIGNDIDLWGLAAVQLHRGFSGMVQPGYPAVAALLMHLPGVDHLRATSTLSAVGMALLPLVCWLLARRLGAGRWAATWAGLLVLATPRLVLTGLIVSPDALAALGLLGVALAAARLDGSHRERHVALLVFATAALFAVREHGLPCAGVVAVLLVALPGPLDVRLLRVGGLAAGMLLLPAVLGNDFELGEPPWWSRFEMVFRDFLAREPSWVTKGGPDAPTNSCLGLALFALRGAPWAWLWVGLGLGGAWLARVRRVAWVALVPVLPALVVFSQPRHVLVAVPVAAALIAAGAARLAPGLRAGFFAFATLAAGIGLAREVPLARTHLADMVAQATDLRTLGEDLCAANGGDGMSAGDSRAFTFCPQPWYNLTAPATTAAWKVLVVDDRRPGEGWERVALPRARRSVFQLESPTGERPCATSHVPAGLSVLSQGSGNPELEPPCAASLPMGVGPTPRGAPPR
jgi:hypothetical protein